MLNARQAVSKSKLRNSVRQLQNMWYRAGSSRQSVTVPRMCVWYVPNHLRCVYVQDLCTRRGCADNRSPARNAYQAHTRKQPPRCVYMQDLWEGRAVADKSSACVECTAGSIEIKARNSVRQLQNMYRAGGSR